MYGITRRDYYAFLAGTAAIVTALGILAGSANVFLMGSLFLGFDVFMWTQNKTEVK